MKKLLHALFFIVAICSAERASAQCTATLVALGPTNICQGDTVTLHSSPGGMYDYQWFINGQLGPIGMEDFFLQADYWSWPPGTYVFEVQITDNNNCTVISNPVSITINSIPMVWAGNDTALCPGGTASVYCVADTATSYTWTGPNGFTSTSQNSTIPNFQSINEGYYSVIANNNGCLSFADDMYIGVMTGAPSIDANVYWGMTNQFCEGDWVNMYVEVWGATSITSASWTGPNNFTSIDAYNEFMGITMADSGLYTVTISGTTCTGTFTLTDTVSIHVNPLPVVTATGNGPVCPGNTLSFSGTVSNSTSYSWTGPNNFTSTLLTESIPNAQLIHSGTYTLTAVNGWCQAYVDVNGGVLSNNPHMELWLDTGYIRCADEMTYMEVWYVTDINNPTYQWTGPNNFNSTAMSEYIQLTNADSGLYTITVSGTGNCNTGTVTLTENFTIDVRACVWPGDVNNDMVVDNIDVLDLGLGYATQGPPRNGYYTWQGQYMTDWGIMQFCGFDMKFADCNGNGILTASDTFGIALNYSLTHQKGYHIPQAKVTSNPDLYFDMTGITLTPGATVSIPIKLGTSSVPMTNVYGLAAQVKISGITPTTGLTVTAPAGWMGSIADALNFTKYISNNQVDWAYVRTDHNNASGEGTIAMLQFEVPAGTQYQQVQLWFDNVKIIGNTGNVITTVNILDDTATIYPVGIANGNATIIINDVSVFPNPSDAAATLQISALQATKVQVQVTDVTGREIWSAGENIGRGMTELALPVSNIAAGIYTIQVKDERGTLAKTLKWIRN